MISRIGYVGKAIAFACTKGLTFVCARVWFKNKMLKRCKKGFLKDIRVLKIGRNFHLGKGLARQNGLFSDCIENCQNLTKSDCRNTF